MRTPLLWPVTVLLTAVWVLAASLTLWSGFPAGPLAKAALLAAAVYGAGMAVLRSRG